jgi:hypothetical protein
MAGCAPGKQWVSVEAEGYAATTLAADFAADATPVRLVLQRGSTLRLRVVDKDANPIRWARALLTGENDPGRPAAVQASFIGSADAEGRIVWTNAPDEELSFNVGGSLHMSMHAVKFRPDGEEHVITLSSALVVHGTVRDESSGQPIPKFRIVAGWPETNSMDGTTNAHWSNEAQFWFDFANGKYSQTFEEPVSYDRKSHEYILRFEAEGYTPWVSPVIAAEAGDVQIDAVLRPAKSLMVTVYKPDGQLAGGMDVGLIFPGVHLLLNNAGLARGNSEIIGSMLQTQPNGQFALSSDNSITRVVAANPDGYAEATPAALSQNPVIQLQPWGRLEVTCLAGGKAAAGREYQLEFSGGILDSISFEPKIEVKTDEQGKFSVSQMPPGRHQLTRLRPQLLAGLGKSWEGADKASFEIRPGVTTTLAFAGSSFTVTGRRRGTQAGVGDPGARRNPWPGRPAGNRDQRNGPRCFL